ncbi:hypothetical protein CD30_13040 [Ureibacillus massiliensis 4400831 = CIP 108448 = CCUG 49529]|uniref:Uncharacterized protein n=1 Tax=Ureibacillus massiliensis 4400831 = CIP 108448 = CCUG 49529 TaxID=1211035 RepID=A0A0A3IZM8_9BACL|nr:hypothetical protein [Ureibacillus massiliensis]KGR90171.1 hypothetical protein CD30_13040 [Ureibacillus massiliensis 4400831 = CIP 108448 = CCUG 49529]
MEDFKVMLEEVKEILAEGYKQRGKVDIATFIEQVDTDAVIKLAEPLIQSQLKQLNMTNEEWASL